MRNAKQATGPYAHLWLDALVVKCREDHRIQSVCCVIATAVNSEGHREVLGLDLVTSEDGATAQAREHSTAPVPRSRSTSDTALGPHSRPPGRAASSTPAGGRGDISRTSAAGTDG